MPFVRDKFIILREIPLDGFTGDPDWVDDYDAAAARAAGSRTCVPTNTGEVDVVFGYLDVDGDLIGPDMASNVDYEIVMVGTQNTTAIFTFEAVSNQVVTDVGTLQRTLGGSSILVIRIEGLASTPVGAVTLACALRIG